MNGSFCLNQNECSCLKYNIHHDFYICIWSDGVLSTIYFFLLCILNGNGNGKQGHSRSTIIIQSRSIKYLWFYRNVWKDSILILSPVHHSFKLSLQNEFSEIAFALKTIIFENHFELNISLIGIMKVEKKNLSRKKTDLEKMKRDREISVVCFNLSFHSKYDKIVWNF